MQAVLITGASGFIARHLAAALRVAGWRVIGTSRQDATLAGFDRIYRGRLGGSLAEVFAREAVDAVVHTALDAGTDAYETNVEGTTRWLEEATAAGVGTQVFLSSLSADAQALSEYGRAKYVLEQRFLAADQIVFRLGVVVGDGGMFGRMVDSVRRSPVVPLLDNGAQLIYVLGIDFLCAVMRDALASAGQGLRGRAWNLQQPTPYPLREVIRAICAAYGLRRILVPLPARPLVGLLRLFEKQAVLRLPVTSVNVQGLIQQGRREFPSDFPRFGYAEEPLSDLVTRAARHISH